MVVQHNLTAMNSNRMLGLTTKSQAKSTERLSSGYKINRAADDAAGLAISEKMRRQVRGLTQASSNAQDGISAVQTAEGALTEVHDMLQRMNELATKAANGTNSSEERDYIQSEVDALIDEIDRVSETTKFNELYLLKGGGTKEVTVTTPTQAAIPVSASYASGKGGAEAVAVKGTAANATFGTATNNIKWYAQDGTEALTNDQVLAYVEVKTDGTIALKDGVKLYTNAANESSEYGAQTEEITFTADLFTTKSTKVSTSSTGANPVAAEDLKNLFDDYGNANTTIYAQKADGDWEQIGAEQLDNFITVDKAQPEVPSGETTKTVAKDLEFNLHVGAEGNDDNKITVKIEAMSAEGIGVKSLRSTDGDVTSGGVRNEDAATASIETIKAAIKKVSQQRSDLGAVQNRLEHTINNLDNIVENTQSAESAIRDTDMATEMVKYANNNILAQAGQAMLAQANQANQGVLSLLG
ncbi:MAG: ubiquitin-like protein Pup [Eubacterium sp.]|nr:ubiquitin-like protein Pup [Eubacterium sp.]